MALQLDAVVPFGRSLAEYQGMFRLTEEDLRRRILGVADGPASFNASMAARGSPVVSLDPLYVLPAERILERFHAVVDGVIEQVKATPEDWVWSWHGSPERLRAHRTDVLQRFVADYEQGRVEGRYLVGELPALPFEDRRFDLALCSHFLFLYSDHFTYEFHRASALEMLRVATEVRIFPLLTLALKRSPYLQPLIDDITAAGFVAGVEPVSYELQRGGNEMLRLCWPA